MSIRPLDQHAAEDMDEVADHPVFDIASFGLRPRTALVEASAGTGKTTATATLTVRALGEGFCSIDQVMLITFTTKAAAELRTRVYRRLSETIEGLEAGTADTDELGSFHRRDPDVFLENLREAAANFDRATITTIHGFCQTMLQTLGVHVDHDSSDTPVETVDDLMDEIADDLYLRGEHGNLRVGPLESVRRLVREGLRLSHVPVPAGQQASPRAQMLSTARAEFEQRKRRRQVYCFDDMTGRLEQALEPGSSGQPTPAAAILVSRYRLVIVDEFQDTDQQQWHLIRDAFHGSALLLLIGDPKQAIYRFRGADVQAYLNAGKEHEQFSLRKNYRSSAAVVAGVDAILNRAQLGSGIQTPPAVAEPCRGLVDAPGDWVHPVQLRLVGSNDSLKKYPLGDAVADLVSEVRQLLEDRPEIHLPRQAARRLKPRDVAVLVRTGSRLRQVTEALTAAGVPVAGAGTEGLLQGEAARAWLSVLEVLLNFQDGALRKAALSPLIGWDIPRLISAGEAEFDQLAQVVRELSQLWISSGFAVMADALMSRFSVHERLAQQPQGAQLLSDVLQVAELAHAHALSHRASPEAVRRWLVQEAESRREVSSRVGSEANAVQVLTIHGAKGLGFPIVLLPDLFDPTRRKGEPDSPRLRHDEVGAPELDVSEDAGAQQDPEYFEEDLRLAYVAMTRAQVALRLWWGPSTEVHRSMLHRLLVMEPGDSPRRRFEPLRPKGQVDAMQAHLASARFAPLDTRRAPRPRGDDAATSPGQMPEQPMGAPRRWTRYIDRAWRRTSYSGLTAALHDLAPHHGIPANGTDVVRAGRGGLDEPDVAEGVESTVPTPSEQPMVSPLAGVPGGTDFGSLVHAILEHVDPQAPDLAREIRAAAAPYLAGFGAEVDHDGLIDALVKVFHSPLGDLTGGTLADLPASDRLAELDFEMTMGASAASSTVGDVAALFSDRSLLPADDPLAHYGEVLAATPAAHETLNGFLNGSIDAVLRVGEKFVVVDYKTNMMPLAPGEELTVQHYDAAAMTQAMVVAHYPLQALIYTVALHRILGWRLSGYDPGRHLGGVGYLFVRGMAGPDTPVLGGMPAGVFTWRPPARFVQAADAILGGRR